MQLNLLLESGIVIFVGFLLGEAATLIKLPKVSGYIIAGILLNPGILPVLSENYADKATPLINVALSFITFSIGGVLSFANIRKSGKLILLTTISESLFAYIFTGVLIFIAIFYILHLFSSWPVSVAVSLMLASLAAPTDPSATLAVTNEYHAKGVVSSTILGIAAFDDIMGIILYTLTLSFARYFLGASDAGLGHSLSELGVSVGGAIVTGIIFGLLFNFITKIFKKESEGGLIVIISGILILCYGTSTFFHFDELLSTMMLGVMVINFNLFKDKIFKIIERYTDELIFVIFFTLSGLQLDVAALSGSAVLIFVFIVARAIGKFTGVYVATSVLGAPGVVKKFTAGGLFPQGGIVIGLALLLSKEKAFEAYSSLIIGIVIGATVIHELLGPVISKATLKKAGEIK
jgi:Kef-type K+ transport system membrane component KefB